MQRPWTLQILAGSIHKPEKNPYYRLLLLIRKFCRYVLQHRTSSYQAEKMDETLVELMQLRMDLTWIGPKYNPRSGKLIKQSNFLPSLKMKVRIAFQLYYTC